MQKRETKVLWEKWLSLKNVPVIAFTEKVKLMFENIKKAVCNQLITDSALFSRLKKNDEAIFSHLEDLMGVYRKIIDISNEYKDENEDVKLLLISFCDVISSRLKNFDDLKSPDTLENPILTEKNEIIKITEDFVVSKIDEQCKKFAFGLKDDNELLVWDESFDLIFQNEYYTFFSIYREGLRKSLMSLDNLESRETAKKYKEILEKEWEVLENIIKHELKALVDAGDLKIVPSIIGLLREIHKETLPIIFELSNEPTVIRPNTGVTFDEFESILNNSLAHENNTKEADEFFEVFKNEINFLVDGLSIEFLKNAYKLQRLFGEEILLSDEVSEIFSNVIKEVIIPETLISPEKDIINGIKETIEIKIDSLRENTSELSTNGFEMVKNLQAEKINFSDEERLNLAKELNKLWINIDVEEKTINEFFVNCLKDAAFIPFYQTIEKQIKTYFDKAQKEIFKFKKEVLLYEICTYEEILTHSVSRLNNSELQEVKDIAHNFTSASKKLEVNLKKNSISVIRPNPHELFDAKEHEVLVAEKQEGFNRGEIIKIVTAGYRLNENVIVRANVIAAK